MPSTQPAIRATPASRPSAPVGVRASVATSAVKGLVVGLVISILQTITSIQEQTLTFTPRLIGVGLAIIFTMAWALQTAVYFTVRMFAIAAGVTR